MHIHFRKEVLTERPVRILLLSLLASLAFVINLGQFSDSTGKDFYQYWVVGKAQQYSNHRLENPYVYMAQYDGFVKNVIQNSADLRLQKASKAQQKRLILNQTPLCYLFFANFPSSFSLSWGIFWSLALALFFAAFMLLSSAYHGERFWFLLLALLLVIFFDPLHSDLGVGNLACWQFFGLALSLWLAHRLLSHNNLILLTTSALLCLQVFLTLLKPNLLPVSLLLGAHLWKRHGFRLFGPATFASASFGAILIILPCLWLHSWRIWGDWFRCLGNLDNQTLLSWTRLGNFAPVTLLAQSLGIGISAVVVATAAGIGILMMMALVRATPPGDNGWCGWGRTVGRALGNPDLCISAGVIIMLTLSPLVWSHYYLLTLLPALWLISRPRWRLVNLLGWSSIFLASGLPLKLVSVSSWGIWIAYAYASNLAFLLVGLLAIMATGETSPGLIQNPSGGKARVRKADAGATIHQNFADTKTKNAR